MTTMTFEAKITVTFDTNENINDDDTRWEEAGEKADSICRLVKDSMKDVKSIDISNYDGCYADAQ